MSVVSPIPKHVHFKEEITVHIVDRLCYELKPSSSTGEKMEVFEKAVNNDKETVAFLQMSCMKDRSGTLLLDFLSYIDNLETVPALMCNEFVQGLDTALLHNVFYLALKNEPKIASELVEILEQYMDVLTLKNMLEVAKQIRTDVKELELFNESFSAALDETSEKLNACLQRKQQTMAFIRPAEGFLSYAKRTRRCKAVLGENSNSI